MKKKIKLKKGSFEYAFYQKADPAVKHFLAAYLGDKLLNLEPEAYAEIDKIIQESFYYFACNMPDTLHIHRTIKDADEWDKALDNFKITNIHIAWPDTEHWFDRDFGTSDDEDSFLEDAHDFDLTETERQAKKIVEAADNLIDYAQNFGLFMRAGYQALNPVARKYMEENAIFDLSILSEEGFNALQNQIDMLIEILLENLLSIIQDE